MRSQMLGELKRYDAAIADLRRVTELAPDFAEAWGVLGWYLILQGDFPAAQVATAKAQVLAPDKYAWTVNLGHTYLLQGDRQTAHDWYQKALPLITDEEELKSGPLADFDLFIERGWQVETSREERAWLDTAARQVILENQYISAQYLL
jgi:tetratricopeptide (TPR) repeat protein